jgi:hypothetical protein
LLGKLIFEIPNSIWSNIFNPLGETAVNGVKNSETDAIHNDTRHANYDCSVLPSADSAATENSGQREVVQQEIPCAKQEDSDLVIKLEPGTLELHVAEITPSYSSSTGKQHMFVLELSHGFIFELL